MQSPALYRARQQINLKLCSENTSYVNSSILLELQAEDRRSDQRSLFEGVALLSLLRQSEGLRELLIGVSIRLGGMARTICILIAYAGAKDLIIKSADISNA